MLTVRFIRENKEKVKANISYKGQDEKLAWVDDLLQLDEQWRKDKKSLDDLRHERNEVSESINKAKKAGKDAKALLAQAKELPKTIKCLEEAADKAQQKIKEYLFGIPNIVHPDVPQGKDETENVERKAWGEQKTGKVKNHVELAESLDVADFDASALVAGNGFYYLKKDLALLNQALIRFAVDFMVEKGYEYTEAPLMVRRNIIDGVMSFKEMDDMIYKVEGEDLYLIGTSEHSLIGQFIDQTLRKEDLPIKLASYSVCFRKEIGSHGINEKGLWRTHQFNKVEQVIICTPEQSWELFDELLANAEDICQALGLPYRVAEMCTGDLGDLKARQYDVEVWRPTIEDYGEIMSCSNLTAAQATRLNIKYVDKKGDRDYCHTLNNTALATSRIMVGILENFQQPDGSVIIPEALRQHMGRKERITPT
ncbi:serine--tRNA ligase [Candidatus Woesearchaeota archaeon]|nr:serine--tRNA ligase [Candidatus Woesearchaeota archaeon]